jgi:hypothetical protein
MAIGRKVSKAAWVLALAASIPVSFLLDHFVVRRFWPALHNCATIHFALNIGKLKTNVPGEWGLVVTWVLPFIVAALLAFPYHGAWPNRSKVYKPRVIKIVLFALALPLALIACALISPLAEWFKIPTDYFSVGLKLRFGDYDLAEVEESLLFLPLVYLGIYWLFRRAVPRGWTLAR